MEKGAKLLDMIPENLRQSFIEEVKEMLLENKVDKETESKKAEKDIHEWAAKTNPQPAKS